MVMTRHILAAIVMFLSITVVSDAWEINNVSLHDRLDYVSSVMGAPTRATYVEDVVVTLNSGVLDAYDITTITLQWRRGGYEVTTTVEIPLSHAMIMRHYTLFKLVWTTTQYYTHSTFTMRRIVQ
jgi:hypothetical protein